MVGTTFVYPEEKEPQQGRVLVLRWEGGEEGTLHTSTQTLLASLHTTRMQTHTHTPHPAPPTGKLSQVAYTLVEGPVYSLAVVSAENRLAVAAFSTVFLYNWLEEGQKMEQDCSYEGCILALYMKAKGDFVLVGSCWGPRGILCWWVRVGGQGEQLSEWW